MTTRAMFSLDEEVMERFRVLGPDGERSKLVEQLLRKEIATRERERDERLTKVAQLVETHPDFADGRAVSDEVDGITGEMIE